LESEKELQSRYDDPPKGNIAQMVEEKAASVDTNASSWRNSFLWPFYAAIIHFNINITGMRYFMAYMKIWGM
jgi:hypothetical protein